MSGRLSDTLSSSCLPPVLIRSFEAIYLLSCHRIASLLLRTINIVRAIHCLCNLANYKRQNRYLAKVTLLGE